MVIIMSGHQQSPDYNLGEGFRQFFKGLWIIIVIFSRFSWKILMILGKWFMNYGKKNYRKMNRG